MPETLSKEDIEKQDFADWNDTPKEEIVVLKGKSFLFRTPEDSDTLINALVNTDKSKSLKALCLSVVASPDISEAWDKWTLGHKMSLCGKVNTFLGLDEDFLVEKKKKR